MDREEIQNKIQWAKELVGGNPEDPFIQIAFCEVLRILLHESFISAELNVAPKVKQADLPTQVSEFLAQKNVKSHIDRIIIILFHRHYKGHKLTTIAELEESYSSARVKTPRNFSDVLADCVRKGYVVEANDKKEGRKAWHITPTGERFVEEELGR